LTLATQRQQLFGLIMNMSNTPKVTLLPKRSPSRSCWVPFFFFLNFCIGDMWRQVVIRKNQSNFRTRQQAGNPSWKIDKFQTYFEVRALMKTATKCLYLMNDSSGNCQGDFWTDWLCGIKLTPLCGHG